MSQGPGTAPAVMTPAGLSACLDRLGADIAAVNAAITTGILGDVASSTLPETALKLLAVADRARAGATVTVGRVHAAGVLSGDGYVSTKTWLRAKGRLSDVEAGRLLARARDLTGDYQATATAWLAGDITTDHVREITLGLKGAVSSLEASLRDALRARGQDVLVEIARVGSPEQVKAAATRLRNAADPDGASQDEIDNYDAQSLRLTPCPGGTVPKGFLDTESSTLLQTALDRVIDRWHREGTLPTSVQPVIDPDTGLIDLAATEAAAAAAAGRTGPSQRQHLQALALTHIVERFLGEEAGDGHKRARPHLSVSVNLADLLAGRGSGELDQPGSEPVPIPISTVARIACQADLTLILNRLTTDGDVGGGAGGRGPVLVPADGNLLSVVAKDLQNASRELLWLGRTHRSVNTPLWNALVARDQHCQFPGCRVDPTRCHPHHVREWEQHNGPTDLDNLILLCPRHHRMVHARDWRITPTPGKNPFQTGYWTIGPPPRPTRH